MIDLSNQYRKNGEGIELNKSWFGESSKQIALDNYAAVYYIPEGKTIRCEENKQLVNFNRLTIDGNLVVRGQLILK